MSSTPAPLDSQQSLPGTSASSTLFSSIAIEHTLDSNANSTASVTKNKKSKKKKTRDKTKTNRGSESKVDEGEGVPDGEDDGNEPDTPVYDSRYTDNGKTNDVTAPENGQVNQVEKDRPLADEANRPSHNGLGQSHDTKAQVNGTETSQPKPLQQASEDHLAVIAQEREDLRQEVIQLRQSLEDLRDRYQSEAEAAKNQLQESRGEKEQAETQYRNLLGKVNTIRSQLGERLKADAVRTDSLGCYMVIC